MNIIIWILSILFLLLSAYLTFVNWSVFINNYILKKPFVSAVTFGGGLLGGIGLIILPVENAWKWFWVPFVIDWGSLPVIIFSIVYAIREYAKGKK